VTSTSAHETTIDESSLARWLDAQDLPGTGQAMSVNFITGGSQNEIFEIRRGDLHAALRKPPSNAPQPRDEGIIREWRIIEALDGSDVPHTPAIAVCTDTSVLGRPFYLMGYVDGWSLVGGGWPPPFNSDTAARRGLALELVEGIVKMGDFDWQARGLTDLGRPDGFHDRQVERWMRFYNRIAARELPGLDVATQWLATHRPLDFVPGLMHGDYQFPNVMYHHGAPAQLAAIIDWEMGTIGDPKLDLAWVLREWPRDTSGGSSAGTYDVTGMPGYSELLEYYSSRSGRQVDDFDYYCVLAAWKLAIVLEQGYQRAGSDPTLQGFGSIVVTLMARAAELARSSSYKGPEM
jgi:aminoglycoside phosphotransferase (APT) family kinase protein